MRDTTRDDTDERTDGRGDATGGHAARRPGRGGDLSTRRRVLTAIGTACIPAVAGCSGDGSGGGNTPTADPTPTASPEPTSDATSIPTATSPPATATMTDTATTTTATDATTTPTASDDIHPRFGFVGTRGTAPPVDPDHTVRLLIRERESVPIPEFYFEPTGLAVDVGDTVKFEMTTPHHNVNAYHPAFGYTQRVPTDAPPYSSPILSAGEYWLYTFRHEGVHNIMCSPHELFGMVGTVVVGSPTGPGASPVGEAPAPSKHSRSPEFTAGLVLSDPALAPETVAAEGSVSWEALAPESKRPLLRPVEGGG